jgi:hypothetical protein
VETALAVFGAAEGVLRVGLAGDHLRIITRRGLGKRPLEAAARAGGLKAVALELGEPTLEDVFLSLAKG